MSDLSFPVYPAWADPGRSRWDAEDSAAQQAFQSAYNRAADQKADMNMLKFRQQMADEQQQKQSAMMSEMLTPVANAFAGVKSPAQAWEVASQHPEWMANPVQGELVDRILKTQNEVAKAQIGSLQGQMNVADTTDFMKRLSTIDATDRASIRAMSPNKDGSVSAMQWQALGLAEERGRVAAENRRAMAENEAISRGDLPTTTITDKGVETVYKPAPTPKGTESPQTMKIDGGVTLAWVPGGKTLHVIKSGGEKNELTPTQLRNIADGLKRDDPRKNQILEFLANKASGQTSAPTNTQDAVSPPAPTTQKVLRYNAATGKLE